MSKENVNLVRNLYGLFAKGDVPSVLAGLDPQIEWNEADNFPYSDGNPQRGPDAVLEGVFMRLGSEWDYWNLAIDGLLDAGDTVVAMGRYQAKNKATGREIDAQFAHLWTLRDGKAVAFQQYADTYQVVNAMAPGQSKNRPVAPCWASELADHPHSPYIVLSESDMMIGYRRRRP